MYLDNVTPEQFKMLTAPSKGLIHLRAVLGELRTVNPNATMTEAVAKMAGGTYRVKA